jgi:predicted nucleic acid-binding protein
LGPEYEVTLPTNIQVAAKDIHVLASAIGTRSHYLLTGDRNHFATHFHQTIAGVTIMLPGEFLDRYPHV